MYTPRRATLALVAAAIAMSSMAATRAEATVAPAARPAALPAATVVRSCANPAPGLVACAALVRTDARGHVLTRSSAATTTPGGYGPSTLQQAYNLSSVIGNTGTVAIVDAFDNPNAAVDLAAYRKQYGLPACTVASGCFKKVNQNGGATPPSCPALRLSHCIGWGVETSLDLDMVSATCPRCNIVLVEASDETLTALGIAATTAGKLSHVVSNSYGGPEVAGVMTAAHYFSHAGVIFVASSGDTGYAAGPQFPAAYPNVVAVGGTSLRTATNARGFTESAWAGAGSGCSTLAPKRAWQHDPSCSGRMVADVSAVADPATAVALYDSYGEGGWLEAGGTSVAAPIIAGVFALAGNAATIPSNAKYTYAHSANLFDVTTGSNGSCAGSYFCTAKPGYDGPTGLGTPNGIAAF